ncbi:MAG TPA: SRPBCC domain-containing protein [Acidobacteriota bacterium]|nr:SRPBCC domain-containing protein [Acidobacteriota bacterium]
MTESRVETEVEERGQLGPVHKTIEVDCPRQKAFEIFTARMADWWPLSTHSVSLDRAAFCGFEPRVGGQLYEERDDGRRFQWGTVLAWDAPRRIQVTWHPGYEEDRAQRVEVRFHEDGSRTRVELIHSGWEVLGERAQETRQGYDSGWDAVLNLHYLPACRA